MHRLQRPLVAEAAAIVQSCNARTFKYTSRVCVCVYCYYDVFFFM